MVRYWHLWTDADGVSHQQHCTMAEFELKSMQPPAAPQWQGAKSTGAMSVLVTVQPVGWVGIWHENPKPQWIVPLSGRWFVESMDGTRVELGAGEISSAAISTAAKWPAGAAICPARSAMCRQC